LIEEAAGIFRPQPRQDIEDSGGCLFRRATGSPDLAKGAESGVATVPGWMATRIACGWVRANSIAALRRIWFSAALLAR